MNRSVKTITIIGGGLAGLTLGLVLRRRDIPVVIREAGTYPRHRVCGEFVRENGLAALRRLGLLDALDGERGRAAGTSVLSMRDSLSPIRRLPESVRCASRFELDAWLARHFRELGGDLRCGERWTGDTTGEGLVGAGGRRPRTEENGWRWYGLKAHATGLELAADLEMHFSANGYVGLCRLPGDAVNVCGLFRRRRKEPLLPDGAPARLAMESGDGLRERLASARWDEKSFCAVAGLSYLESPADRPAQCAVGDAMGLIPPVTGNGMSMAFESAELALEPLTAYARGAANWAATCACIRKRRHRLFGRRLWAARCLHRALFLESGRKYLLCAVARSDWLWRLFFRVTR